MAYRIEGVGWACSICNRIHPSQAKADACRDTHDVLYIPITHTELNRLIQAIMLENFSMIPESLITTLRRYQRIHYKDS